MKRSNSLITSVPQMQAGQTFLPVCFRVLCFDFTFYMAVVTESRPFVNIANNSEFLRCLASTNWHDDLDSRGQYIFYLHIPLLLIL